MDITRWSKVDSYFEELFDPKDPALEQAIRSAEQAGMPQIQVAPNQGKLLHILARSIHARSILEIGTLAGYSTIWLARAVPKDGFVVSLEAVPKHAEIARENVRNAGVGDKVQILEGRALDSLPKIAAGDKPPFDFVFIDADKENNPAYFAQSLAMCHPGSLIVVDNVVRDGEIIDPESTDNDVRGVRRFHEMVAADQRVVATAIQTVGVKGYDGFTIALVVGT